MKSLDQTPVEPGAAASPARPGAPRLAVTAEGRQGPSRDPLHYAAEPWVLAARVIEAARYALDSFVLQGGFALLPLRRALTEFDEAARRDEAARAAAAASGGATRRADANAPDSATGAGS